MNILSFIGRKKAEIKKETWYYPTKDLPNIGVVNDDQQVAVTYEDGSKLLARIGELGQKYRFRFHEPLKTALVVGEVKDSTICAGMSCYYKGKPVFHLSVGFVSYDGEKYWL